MPHLSARSQSHFRAAVPLPFRLSRLSMCSIQTASSVLEPRSMSRSIQTEPSRVPSAPVGQSWVSVVFARNSAQKALKRGG